MSDFWNAWVWVLVIAFLSFISWLLYSNYIDSHSRRDHHRLDETHDGIGERYAPIPVWWAVGMWLTIVFAVAYLVLYPGLGRFPGLLNWTTEKALLDEQKSNTILQETLKKYRQVDVEKLAGDPQAVLLGQRIFRNNCAVCHGHKGEGSWAFPNLTDDDWLYGHSADAIKTSITEGRTGAMPAWKETLQATQIEQLAQAISGTPTEEGDALYASYCAACHGANKEGNPFLGVPNLADDIWLYGGSFDEIKQSILVGRNGEMPAHKEMLSAEKIHLLTSYILSLSTKKEEGAANE
jgi:cytochrome c oxidase cbb3-type subunit 3